MAFTYPRRPQLQRLRLLAAFGVERLRCSGEGGLLRRAGSQCRVSSPHQDFARFIYRQSLAVNEFLLEVC